MSTRSKLLVVTLWAFLLLAGQPAAECIWGDADGSGDITTDDVVYILMYMFYQGPEPVACPGVFIDLDSAYVQDHWVNRYYGYRLWADTLQEIWVQDHVVDSFYVVGDSAKLLFYNRTLIESTYDTISLGTVSFYFDVQEDSL